MNTNKLLEYRLKKLAEKIEAEEKSKDTSKTTPLYDDDERLVGDQDELPDHIQKEILKAAAAKAKKEEEKGKDPKFSPKYDDDPALVGDQDELPDFLQEQILKAAAAKKKKDSRLANAGVSGYNKPKRTPNHPTKSHIVVAKKGDKVKTIRFGQQGVRTNQTAGQRKAFKSRHGKNIAKGNMSAAYWANKVKWSPSKTKNKKSQKWVKGSSDSFARLHEAIKEAKEKGTATKRDPKLWAQAKAEAKRKMGGKHSARAMQLATQIYKKKGGKYKGKKPSAKNNKLKKWTKQDWQWSSEHRKKSAAKKEKGVYLPKADLDRHKSTDEGKKLLAGAVRKKTEATRKGKQYSQHGLAKNAFTQLERLRAAIKEAGSYGKTYKKKPEKQVKKKDSKKKKKSDNAGY